MGPSRAPAPRLEEVVLAQESSAYATECRASEAAWLASVGTKVRAERCDR